MYYYFIDNKVTSSNIELNAGNGFGRAIPISQAQYEFGIAYPRATYEQIIALDPPPEPEPVYTEPQPTLQEVVEANSDALDELIQYIYGS